MGVVTKYGTGIKDPAALGAIDGINAAAELRRINSRISITNADSATSKFYIGTIPFDAIIDPNSVYTYTALTSLTDIDVGFAYQDGTVIDADNLIDGDDVSSAGQQTIKGHGTLTTANQMKRVWELAGLTSNPGGYALLVLTLKADAGASGTIDFLIDYSKGA